MAIKKIYSRETSKVLFEGNFKSKKQCIEKAIRNNICLHNANMYGLNLYRANLKNADLRWIDFSEADLCEANLENSDLRYSIFIGTDLTSANLTNANLMGTEISKAYLRNANLFNAQIVCHDKIPRSESFFAWTLGSDYEKVRIKIPAFSRRTSLISFFDPIGVAEIVYVVKIFKKNKIIDKCTSFFNQKIVFNTGKYSSTLKYDPDIRAFSYHCDNTGIPIFFDINYD